MRQASNGFFWVTFSSSKEKVTGSRIGKSWAKRYVSICEIDMLGSFRLFALPPSFGKKVLSYDRSVRKEDHEKLRFSYGFASLCWLAGLGCRRHLCLFIGSSNLEETIEVGVVPHDFSSVEGFEVVVEVETGLVGVNSNVIVPSDSVNDAFDGVVVHSAGDEFAASVNDELVDVGVVFVKPFELFFSTFKVCFVGCQGWFG